MNKHDDAILRVYLFVLGWISYLGATAVIGFFVYWSWFMAPAAGQPIIAASGTLILFVWVFASWALTKPEAGEAWD